MKKNGFTLVETLIVVAITGIVAFMMFFSFATYGSNETISKDQAKVVSILEKARSMTLDSYNDSQYGVHFGTSSVTIFAGVSYNPASTTNIVTDLNSNVYVKNVQLAGGGNEIIFNRLSGQTNQMGTTTLALIGNASTTRSVTVFSTGLIQPN